MSLLAAHSPDQAGRGLLHRGIAVFAWRVSDTAGTGPQLLISPRSQERATPLAGIWAASAWGHPTPASESTSSNDPADNNRTSGDTREADSWASTRAEARRILAEAMGLDSAASRACLPPAGQFAPLARLHVAARDDASHCGTQAEHEILHCVGVVLDRSAVSVSVSTESTESSTVTVGGGGGGQWFTLEELRNFLEKDCAAPGWVQPRENGDGHGDENDDAPTSARGNTGGHRAAAFLRLLAAEGSLLESWWGVVGGAIASSDSESRAGCAGLEEAGKAHQGVIYRASDLGEQLAAMRAGAGPGAVSVLSSREVLEEAVLGRAVGGRWGEEEDYDGKEAEDHDHEYDHEHEHVDGG